MRRFFAIFVLGVLFWVDHAKARPPGDFNADCRVDLNDLAVVAERWLQGDLSNPEADLHTFSRLTEDWLQTTPSPDGTVLKQLDRSWTGANLVQGEPHAWIPWREGYEWQDPCFICDNGADPDLRGLFQDVIINQSHATPILARLWSQGADVSGAADTNYSLYLDIDYTDGTHLYGRTFCFDVDEPNWQRGEVIVLPPKPIQGLRFWMLFRHHSGRAVFRDPQLYEFPQQYHFDGQIVAPPSCIIAGFQIRDVAQNSDFVRIQHHALDLQLDCTISPAPAATFYDVTLSDPCSAGRDRAVTLYYSIPVVGDEWNWLRDPRRADATLPGSEYMVYHSYEIGANGRLSRYPFAAIARADQGIALGIDMAWPAFYRLGFNTSTNELFLAYDIALTPEKPFARLRFCRFSFDPAWQFRAALAHYYDLFPGPHYFHCRVPEQGIWMPFSNISDVADPHDFGFKFKEGNEQTAWDDAHGILTFRYTNPMMWWMPMPSGASSRDDALAEAQRLADNPPNQFLGDRAQALFTSGFHDSDGTFIVQISDPPWTPDIRALWALNSMPGIEGQHTEFNWHWNEDIITGHSTVLSDYDPCNFHDPDHTGLDGEFLDIVEGDIWRPLNYRRDHFAATQTPLTFARVTHQPVIFNGLAAFEYIRRIARDLHGASDDPDHPDMGKLIMANGTPRGLCFLTPLLDVPGEETDWHPRTDNDPNGIWSPMTDAELLYRRALCKAKPYGFLMNTDFDLFGLDLVEKYMQRCLAYGIFPSFFSANGTDDRFFADPKHYEPSRHLFRTYIPLIKRIAEAGWEPITNAVANDPIIYLERFGTRYLTVFNDSSESRDVTIQFHQDPSPTCATELITNTPLTWPEGQPTIRLGPQNVALLDLDPNQCAEDK